MAMDPPATGPPARDMSTHFTILGIIYLIFSIPAFLFGLVLLTAGVVGGAFAEGFSGIPGLGSLVAGAGVLLGLLVAAFGVPGTVFGIGALKRRPWAKPWGFVVCILSLFSIPLGTALGIYGLWALTRPETEAYLSVRADAATRPA